MSLSFFCFLGWSLWQCCSNYWCCAAVVPGHSALGSTSLCCQQAWAHCYHVLHTACSSYGPNVHVRSLPLSLGMCTSSSPVTKIRYEYLPFLVFQHFLGFWSQTDSWQSSVSITVGCTFWSLPQGNFLEPFWKMDRFSFVFRAWKHQCVICRCPLYFPAGWQYRLNDVCVGV
jgi:hypothetical protein